MTVLHSLFLLSILFNTLQTPAHAKEEVHIDCKPIAARSVDELSFDLIDRREINAQISTFGFGRASFKLVPSNDHYSAYYRTRYQNGYFSSFTGSEILDLFNTREKRKIVLSFIPASLLRGIPFVVMQHNPYGNELDPSIQFTCQKSK